MKKTKIFAALAAIMMLTACSGGNKSGSDDMILTPPDTEAATENHAAPSESNVKGSCYTAYADPDKWVDAISYLDQISQTAGEMNNMNVTPEQIKEMCEAMYFYNPDISSNFNFTAMDDQQAPKDLNIYGEAFKEQYNAVDGVEFLGWEETKINGYRVLQIDVNMTSGGRLMRMRQYIFWESGHQVVSTFTSDPDNFNSYLPDYDAMINTIYFN